MPIDEAPPIPAGLTPPPAGGPDPRLYIPRDLHAVPGQTVTVPVMLQVTDPAGISVGSLDLVIEVDSTRFTVGNFRVGGLLAAAPAPFGAPVTYTPSPNTTTVTMFSINGPQLAPGAEGAVLLFDVTVKANASPGTSAINLRHGAPGAPTRVEVTNNSVTGLLLLPAPTDAADDPVDGLFQIDTSDATPPLADIVNISPDPRSTPVSQAAVHFSEAVLGVDLGDFRLTRNGISQPLTGAILTGTGSDYSLDISALTADRGNYVLSLVATGSGITDLAGNPLTVNASDDWRMNPWHNFSDPLNANGQPGVFAIDALVIFNELSNELLSDPVTGLLPPSAPASAFYYDVNDDGFVTAIDALFIINDINLRPEGEGEFVGTAGLVAPLVSRPSSVSSAVSQVGIAPAAILPVADSATVGAAHFGDASEPPVRIAARPAAAISDNLLELLAADRAPHPRARFRLRR